MLAAAACPATTLEVLDTAGKDFVERVCEDYRLHSGVLIMEAHVDAVGMRLPHDAFADTARPTCHDGGHLHAHPYAGVPLTHLRERPQLAI